MRPLGRRLAGFRFGLCFSFGGNKSRRRRGGKVGISRLRRDFQGNVGAGENLLSVFAGFLAPAFSTALFGCRADQLFSGAAIAPYYGWPVADRNGLVQVLVDRDRAPRQSVAESSLVDLPRPLPDGIRAMVFSHLMGQKLSSFSMACLVRATKAEDKS